jgi:hypothetical protein
VAGAGADAAGAGTDAAGAGKGSTFVESSGRRRIAPLANCSLATW